MKILVVEDDQQTGYLLAETLTSHHFTVNLATNGETGLALTENCEYDLIVLDIVVPKLDGISLCQKIREAGSQTPIMLLTAKDSSTDRVIGLDAGADDYMVKPFDLAEFMARVRALLRRAKASSNSVITWENIRLDYITCEVTCSSHLIHLTSKEYCLLELFLLNPKRIFNRRAILDRLWDFANAPGEETVSTHIKCLRQKLKAAGASDPIETVHGLGYRLKAETPSETSEGCPPPAIPASPPPQQPQQAEAVTKRVWEKFKDKFAEQITLLEQAITELASGRQTVEAFQQAKHLSHKLAGSLGIFGFMDASHTAREIERILQLTEVLSHDNLQQISALLEALKQVVQQERPPAPVVTPPPTALHNAPLMLIVDDDVMLAERIRLEAIAWNLRVEVASTPALARKIMAQTPPQALLLDLNFPGCQEDGFALLTELAQQQPTLPTVVFTSRSSLSDRVKVASLGGYAFLQKPLSPHQILKTLTDALNLGDQGQRHRIMIVDDDAMSLNHIAELLKSQNLDVTVLKQPGDFWRVLTETHPDLLLLDLEMPGFNGVELCQAVRNDPHWRNLPILFLSAHTEETMINRAFAAGADDYISKFSTQTELTTRILRRMQPVLAQ